MVSDKMIHKALRIHETLINNPLEKFCIWNYMYTFMAHSASVDYIQVWSDTIILD